MSGGRLHAVVATVETDLASMTRDDLISLALEHHEILTSIHAATPVLPFRFGQVFASCSDLLGLIDRQETRLVAEIGRIAGFHEYSVTVRAREDVRSARAGRGARAPGGMSGTDFLRGQARRRDALRTSRADLSATATRLSAQLSSLAAATLRAPERGADRTTSFLFAKDAMIEVDGLIEAFERDNGHVECRLNGPWPPYSFVDAEMQA